ncbi:hypothetical protein F5148DRAFT_346735 [Russula earlei]|uniref:Uncharacterized protein n=1 Tax=Russula earlei TaxID=71964 RepID=A0ACC0U1Q7_9AGAM|nr:hypothetical protein F5148DRAFT_346735 [Russula earlei]
MSGRKYRGGSGREGRGRSVINGDDFVHDVIPSHPRNRCPTVKEHVANVTNLNNLEDYLRPQTPARRTIISRGNSFPYGPGWLGGHMCATTSRPKERARMRPLDSKVRNGKASLSQLLYQDRPLLRPIVFVRSEFTPSLFLDEEEIFKPVAEADANHVPTAERVFQIFRHDEERPDLSSDSPSDAEELLEIDFTDLGRVMSEVEALEAVASPTKKAIESSVNNINNQRLRTIGVGVYTNARPSPEGDSSSPVGHIPETRILGEDMDEDDEIIVYVAPHPRNGKLASNLNQSPESFEAIIHHSLADRGPATMRIQHRTYTPPQHTESPAEPISERILATSPSLTSTGFGGVSSLAPFGSSKFIRNSLYPHHDSRRRSQQHATFGSFGAIQAEVVLQEVDLRKDEQRRGDPDVHWGGSTSEESVEGSGMLEDQDIDVYAMQAFVNGMTAAGIAHVSVDDLNDKTKIRAEDEDMETESGAKSDGSSDKDDAQSKLAGDEQDGLALGGALFESEDESTSPSDEGEIPNELFQARLELLRKRMQERPIKDVLEEELDQELEVDEEDGIITTTGVSRSFCMFLATDTSPAEFPR